MTLQLSRTVRFCVNDPPGAAHDPVDTEPRDNTFAAWPAMRGLGRYYELDVTCQGDADPVTGYFINIKLIDAAVRAHALPMFGRAIAESTHDPLGTLLRDLLAMINPALNHTVTQLQLRLTPTYQIALRSHDMDHVLIRQQYEFSAAHRLHVPTFTDQQNRDTFGKCNNPAGHGHNYKLEVVVRAPIQADGSTIQPADLDAAVNRHAIEHLDHKHLNTDIPAFADLNPSVENIVRVIWDMLEPPIAGVHADTSLVELSVWETSKTVCTYRGPASAKAPTGV